MTKESVKALIGKGIVNINGVNCRFDFSKPDDDFIVITVPAINSYTPDRHLGQVWLQYTDDAWWADLEEALAVTQKKMRMQAEIVEREPMKLIPFVSESYGKKLYRNEQNGRVYEIMECNDHFEVMSTTKWQGGYEADGPINAPIEIEGRIYLPIWSWWMDAGCYIHQKGDTI